MDKIQVGKPGMIGVTFDTSGLDVAARVFDDAGAPVTAWMAMDNYDGSSYQVPYTFADEGAYSVKKVVFTDGTFTTRDTGYSEADDALQVVEESSSSSGTEIVGTIENDGELVGSVEEC